MLKILKITGQSMSPMLKDGDYTIVLTRGFRRLLKPGRLVAFRHDRYGPLIKRIVRCDADSATLTVAGDSTLSATSEAIGPVPLADVTGVGLLPIRA